MRRQPKMCVTTCLGVKFNTLSLNSNFVSHLKFHRHGCVVFILMNHGKVICCYIILCQKREGWSIGFVNYCLFTGDNRFVYKTKLLLKHARMRGHIHSVSDNTN